MFVYQLLVVLRPASSTLVAPLVMFLLVVYRGGASYWRGLLEDAASLYRGPWWHSSG